MSGTFSSLSNALSALRYNQVAMDVASGNVANAGTAGYARRQVIAQATGAPATPAMWSRWEGAGDGVQAGSVTRMVDPLLDARSRTEHATASFLDTQSSSLVRFETTLGEPGDNGVAAALSQFKAGWQDVANNPGDGAARSQLLARANTLATAVNSQANAVGTEWDDQDTRLGALTDEVNQVATELDKLNDGLRSANVAGNDAGTLLDQRDQLALRLSELTGSKVQINPDTTATVTLGTATPPAELVDGSGKNPPAVLALPATPADVRGVAGGPVQLTLDGAPVTVANGEVGGTLQVLNTDLPDYLTKLDSFAATLAKQVNDQQLLGADQDGAPGTAMFSTGDPANPAPITASNLSVALTDPRKVAAADLTLVDTTTGAGLLDSSNATAMAALDLGDAQYRSLVTSFGVTVSTAKQLSTNQGVLVAQVDASRESLSGISVDEEMVNLLAAQHGYEGAARVMTAVDSMLDTLINRTGLVR